MTERDKPDLEHGVYRVTYYLVQGGARYLCESDMVFIDGEPTVVLEWSPPAGTAPPILTAPLEPARLQALAGRRGFYLYDGDVADPRTLH